MARAIAPFHDPNGGGQLLCFNEGDTIGVFADSLTSKEDTGWWRGFRFANGPSGGIGMFPSNRVVLFPPQQQQSSVSLQQNEKKKIDFCVQADVISNCSSSEEDDESAASQKAENSTISSGVEEMPHQSSSDGLQKIDDLVSTALPVPLRSIATSTNSTTVSETGNIGSLLVNSSNRNSATSLDSGRGSAYATSSEGLKVITEVILLRWSNELMKDCFERMEMEMHFFEPKRVNVKRLDHIATSISGTFAHPSGCSLHSIDLHAPLRMIPPTTTPTHTRQRVGVRATSLQPSIPSAPSSTSSSGVSSCSSACMANSGERSQVELLVNWLLSAGFSEYTPCLVAAGYDLNTLRRATPEDLNACGVTNPRDRQQLRTRLSRLQLPESLPDHVPSCVFEWLSIINLTNYWPAFQAQGLITFEKICVLTWEDFEEIGVTKLGHQKKLVLAIERLRRAMSKRSEEQVHGTDSLLLNRPHQHQIPSPTHQAIHPASLSEEHEIGRLIDLTPPPPPGFQDPPKVTRKTSIDFPFPLSSPHHLSRGHHKHFSTSFLAEFGRLGTSNAGPNDVGGEGSTKSDPLPRLGDLEIGEKEGDVEGIQKQLKGSQEDTLLSVRQRNKNAAAAAITIPVSVANQMIPPPTSGTTMDKDLQDMQDIRSMLDKLSEHLVSRGSP
ncbi:hypothetical protein Aperf_G00000114834 [Anoplocephala perfoliata]